jgi:hypothetical protein
MSASLPALKHVRALDVLNVIPAGCIGIVVQDNSFAPHLRWGEIAVIDTTDKSTEYGELYLLTFASGCGPVRHIVQLRARGFTADTTGLWYAFAFRGQEKANAVTMDGPLRHECWPEKCLGRVIGILPWGEQVMPRAS